jgi:hypothetical protein
MKRVFGENAPKIDDYFKFEGLHNIGEYNAEISACKIRYGNPHNLTNKQYIETIPTKCRDWISERHDNPEKYSSLFYEAIRKKFHKYPLKYEIKPGIDPSSSSTVHQ